jgi:hypothetical protein
VLRGAGTRFRERVANTISSAPPQTERLGTKGAFHMLDFAVMKGKALPPMNIRKADPARESLSHAAAQSARSLLRVLFAALTSSTIRVHSFQRPGGSSRTMRRSGAHRDLSAFGDSMHQILEGDAENAPRLWPLRTRKFSIGGTRNGVQTFIPRF